MAISGIKFSPDFFNKPVAKEKEESRESLLEIEAKCLHYKER